MKRFALAGLLLCTSLPALAQTSAAAAAPGYMPPARILQCLRDKREVDTLNLEMQREKNEIDQIGAALQQRQLALEDEGKQLVARIYQDNQAANRAPAPADTGGDPRLDRYLRQYAGANGERRKHNKLVAAQKQQLDAHNTQVDEYNLRLSGVRQRAEIVDRHCTGVPVRPEDLSAARAALAAEAGSPGTLAR